VRQVPDDYAGKTAKCPKCSVSNRIEHPVPANKDDAAWVEELLSDDKGSERNERNDNEQAVLAAYRSARSRAVETSVGGITKEQGDNIVWYVKWIFWILFGPIPSGFIVGCIWLLVAIVDALSKTR
jgi:hypothetical protein